MKLYTNGQRKFYHLKTAVLRKSFQSLLQPYNTVRYIVITKLLCILFLNPPTLFGQIVVGPSTQVSRSMEDLAHTEAFIAAHPLDEKQLAVCSMVIDPGQNRLSSALYFSPDGGTSWNLAVHDTVSSRGQAWDPTCGFAPGGTVLFATLPSQGDPLKKDFKPFTQVNRLTNNGNSIMNPTKAPYLDNEDLVVDWTKSPYHGRIYLVGVGLNRSVHGRRHISLTYSTDGGESFHSVIDEFPKPGFVQGNVGAPVVHLNGDLIIPVTLIKDWAPEKSSDTLGVPKQTVGIVRVSEGGTKFLEPAIVSPYESCGEAGPPVVAVDHSYGPFRGRIYMAFPDSSNGRCQIYLSWSDDGENWSSPLPVDDPAIPLEPGFGPDASLPGIAVNNEGVVGISWYDRREDPKNLNFRMRFTASGDGGQSVMKSVPVSEHSYNYSTESEPEALYPLGIGFDADSSGASWVILHTGSSNRLYYNVGDYTGFTARADGKFQSMWIDNRTQVPQLYTAPITVNVKPQTAADRDKKLGRVVSDSIRTKVSAVSYDPNSCTIKVGLELLNFTDRSVTLPLKIRIDEAISQLGVPINLDGEVDDLGRTILTIGTDKKLMPGERISRTTQFRLENCRSLAGRGEGGYRNQLDARLNGKPPGNVSGPKILALRVRVLESESSKK